MCDETSWQLTVKAIALEDALFTDMTLADYPQLTDVLDEWGVVSAPSVERVSFRVMQSDGETFGEYDPATTTIYVVLEELTETTLCHEMIHYYEDALNKLDTSLCQYITIALWEELKSRVVDLHDRIVQHLELTHHRDLQGIGGAHSVLFLLKSYDVDLRLNVPLGTTFGYGYASES